MALIIGGTEVIALSTVVTLLIIYFYAVAFLLFMAAIFPNDFYTLAGYLPTHLFYSSLQRANYVLILCSVLKKLEL